MFSAIADGFDWLFGLIWQVASWVLDGLWKLLQPVFDLIGAIFYFIYKVGVVLYKVVELVLALIKLLIGLATGLFRTITGLAYSGTAPSPFPSAYGETISNLQPIFATLQINKVAYLVNFAIWVMTAIIAMRIIGGMRGGGGSD